jgi:hypothetical protein
MDIMGKTLFVLKIVAIFMKCKAQPNRLYRIGASLSQKEKGKRCLGLSKSLLENWATAFSL